MHGVIYLTFGDTRNQRVAKAFLTKSRIRKAYHLPGTIVTDGATKRRILVTGGCHARPHRVESTLFCVVENIFAFLFGIVRSIVPILTETVWRKGRA